MTEYSEVRLPFTAYICNCNSKLDNIALTYILIVKVVESSNKHTTVAESLQSLNTAVSFEILSPTLLPLESVYHKYNIGVQSSL